MKRTFLRIAPTLRIVLVGVTALMGAAAAGAPQWSPPPVKNLKVFPRDIDPRALVTSMRGFTQALGVRCQHCHAYTGDNPNDLNTFDFASDDKAPKETARTMLRMVRTINDDLLKGVGDSPPPGEAKVTCYTCHRGETRPATRPPA
jgi:photosynthetic reaction center cytochrome c subunit